MAPPIGILEPLSTGDIIDRSIGIYRRNVRGLLATVAIPFMVGSLGWLVVQFANRTMLAEDGDAISSVVPIFLLLFGFLLSLVHAYLMLLAVAGLSRTVGDYVMLGEPITMRAALLAVRSRLLDLTVGSLVLAAGATLGSMIAAGVFLVAIAGAAMAGVAVQGLGLPAVVSGVVMVLAFLLAVGAVVLVVIPLILSRIVFIPQAIMIEGCSASAALSRSMSLGAKNWNRVLAIFVFSYFVSWSLVAAVAVPILLALWLSGHLSFDVQTFDAVFGGISQFSSFLVVPVWSIAYTLLYFDSRVRKEAYDVDLLARRLPTPPRQPTPVAPRVVAPPPAYTTPFPPSTSPAAQVKFAADGRCLRCGRVNMFASRHCAGCGW